MTDDIRPHKLPPITVSEDRLAYTPQIEDVMADDILRAQKLSYQVPVTAEVLADHTGPTIWETMAKAEKEWAALSPAQKAEWRRARQEQRDAEVAEKRTRHNALLAKLTGVVWEIAALHEPDADGDCRVCQQGMDGDAVPWPCETVDIIIGGTS